METNETMEGTTGSSGIDKPWDHAWSTEEMRNNRRDWSLAGDSGLLKHLQQFSENLTRKATETQEAIDSMTSQLNETAILVDNITNTSLALANTQFIESRVQEDNIEIEQPVENITKNENDHEFSATDLLVSVCESIRQGLSIMDEKYEKVEVIASDSEDEDDNPVPSVILRPKDPYQDRPLPYVIGTEQWKSSTKIGLESSSSESEQNDEDEDSESDTDDKNIGNILSSNTRTNLGIGRLSSTSSESNDYNIESSSIKDTDNSRLHARSQDTLNSDTGPTTPSSILPKTQNINNGPPSFAEELAKRLGNVLPIQKNIIPQDSNEQIINRSKDDLFTPEDDQDVFGNKSDNLFSEGKNLFSDEVPSSSWKNKPVKPVNKTVIPPSIDVPPPLSNFSSAPKSTIDDLFGEVDESDDSDDIFSKKSSTNIFAAEKEAIKNEIASKQKNLNVESIQNTSTMTTSTPETNDKGHGLFEDEDDDDLFASASKQVKPADGPLLGPGKKKPVGGVSILGAVDIRASSKFARRPSTSSSSENESLDQQQRQQQSHQQQQNQRIDSNNSTDRVAIITSRNDISSGTNASSSLEAGNSAVAADNATVTSSDNNTDNTSGISMRQPSIDNTAGSSLGADFQPLMSSSRLKSEEIYRERITSDSLFTAKSRNYNSANDSTGQRQQQQQPQQQLPVDDVSEYEDVFGPPPLPKSDGHKSKSKVNSLFDDSDSGDDLFASASPGSRSLKSSERTPSKSQNQKKISLFEDDDDLFGPPKDAPDVDLFGAAPVKNLTKVTNNLLNDVEEPGLFNEKSKTSEKIKSTVNSLFSEDKDSDKVVKDSVDSLLNNDSKKVIEAKPSASDDLFSEKQIGASVKEEPANNLFKEPAKVEKVLETKKSSKGLFDDDDSDLFSNISKPVTSTIASGKAISSFPSSAKNLFEDTPDSDLFGSSSNSILEKNIVEKSSDSLFSDSKESTDIFSVKNTKLPETKKDSPKNLFEDKPKAKALITNIFDDSDEDDDLFGGASFLKKDNKKTSNLFEDDKSISIVKNMDEEKKAETEKESTKKQEVKVKDEASSPKVTSKPAEKTSLFDDDDDDDDDLFGDKKKKVISKEEPKDKEKNVIHDEKNKKEEKEISESKVKTEPTTKPEIVPKKAILAEIKQKLEKRKLEQTEKPEPSVVDGAVISKKEPPKSLKIQTTLPMPKEATSNNQQQAASKKPVVSGKIKNLMGKMGDLKILSPTDTPPLWRKSTEEKSSNEDEQEPNADSGASSEVSTPSLLSGGSSPQHSGTNSKARDSPSIKSDNTEVAISFDEPAQVETLPSIERSKSRARIPAKRRPQSRQARQSALRQSGIDFDYVNASTTTSPNGQVNGDASDGVDRLLPSGKTNEFSHNADNDRSELSASRNTTTNLLSPSTDEEDLFDVPPDLPEDPAAKEDSLFGRAPILSPVEPIEKSIKKSESTKKERTEKKIEEILKKKEEKSKKKDEKEEKKEEPLDPLRDDSHDPLKDPSQLFAFVTKTPSPEKNKGLILNEDDDSLFSSSSKSTEKVEKETKSKPGLDLFVDDDDTSGSDLFSSSNRIKKKPLKETATDLFDEVTPDDDDDSLFGSTTKKNEKESTPEASNIVPKVEEKSEPKNIRTDAKDIFDDSSDDDDIFASSKKALPKRKTKSLFDDDDDNEDDDIFAKPKTSSIKDSKTIVDNDRPVVKKAVTRDLKKTAEKIVEDPLSMLQDD